MVIKEVIESCVSTRAGILLRSLEAIGMPPEERLAYIYDWKTLALDFGLGTLIGIGLGSAGIAFRGAAGEAVEQAVKEGMEDGSNTSLHTYGDALRENLGPAYLSHPEEYNAILNNAKEMGVLVEFRTGTLAYDMEFGRPGN